MTAPTAYTTLDSDDLGANKILRAATMSALDSNPVAIAQRGTGAPWLNGIGAIEAITSGSGNYTVPDGVYRIKASIVGGGGGGGADFAGSGGGSTTFGGLTGGGGSGGYSSGTAGAGGSSSGGTLNISGNTGGAPVYLGIYGAGGAGNGGGGSGGSGGACIAVLSCEPGDLIAYSVGASGAGGVGIGSDDGVAGKAGIIILEY